MKWLILLFIVMMTGEHAAAQKKRTPANSKHTTVVDSINAPPRMDGNTGRYDTVRHPRKKITGKKTDYNYEIGTDSIGLQKKPGGR